MDTLTITFVLSVVAAATTVGKFVLDWVKDRRDAKSTAAEEAAEKEKEKQEQDQQKGLLLIRENQITQQVSETVWRRVNDELKRKALENDRLTERLETAEARLEISEGLLREYIRGTGLLIAAMERAQSEGVKIEIPWRPAKTNGKSISA